MPNEQTYHSFRRQDDVDALAWPVFSQRGLDLLRSAGEVLHPEPGELLWDTRDTYDLYLVLVDVLTVALEFHHGGNTGGWTPMSQVRRFDHVGITVADLDAVTAFFVGLGLEVENQDVRRGRVRWASASAEPRKPDRAPSTADLRRASHRDLPLTTLPSARR